MSIDNRPLLPIGPDYPDPEPASIDKGSSKKPNKLSNRELNDKATFKIAKDFFAQGGPSKGLKLEAHYDRALDMHILYVTKDTDSSPTTSKVEGVGTSALLEIERVLERKAEKLLRNAEAQSKQFNLPLKTAIQHSEGLDEIRLLAASYSPSSIEKCPSLRYLMDSLENNANKDPYHFVENAGQQAKNLINDFAKAHGCENDPAETLAKLKQEQKDHPESEWSQKSRNLNEAIRQYVTDYRDTHAGKHPALLSKDFEGNLQLSNSNFCMAAVLQPGIATKIIEIEAKLQQINEDKKRANPEKLANLLLREKQLKTAIKVEKSLICRIVLNIPVVTPGAGANVSRIHFDDSRQGMGVFKPIVKEIPSLGNRLREATIGRQGQFLPLSKERHVGMALAEVIVSDITTKHLDLNNYLEPDLAENLFPTTIVVKMEGEVGTFQSFAEGATEAKKSPASSKQLKKDLPKLIEQKIKDMPAALAYLGPLDSDSIKKALQLSPENIKQGYSILKMNKNKSSSIKKFVKENLSQIKKDIENAIKPPEDQLTAFQVAMATDVMVGNVDRHEENWMIQLENLPEGMSKDDKPFDWARFHLSGGKTKVVMIDNANVFEEKKISKFVGRKKFAWKRHPWSEYPLTEKTKQFISEKLNRDNSKIILKDLTAQGGNTTQDAPKVETFSGAQAFNIHKRREFFSEGVCQQWGARVDSLQNSIQEEGVTLKTLAQSAIASASNHKAKPITRFSVEKEIIHEEVTKPSPTQKPSKEVKKMAKQKMETLKYAIAYLYKDLKISEYFTKLNPHDNTSLDNALREALPLSTEQIEEGKVFLEKAHISSQMFIATAVKQTDLSRLEKILNEMTSTPAEDAIVAKAAKVPLPKIQGTALLALQRQENFYTSVRSGPQVSISPRSVILI